MMLYITLDTCVWLGLLKVDFNNDDNFFEEICFWIENGHIKHIAPTNIIHEWNRNKIPGKENAIRELKDKHRDLLNFLKDDRTISNIYQPDKISNVIQNRIDRIDVILDTSEKANYDEDILIEAGKRNLNKLPPNHIKEGYKDTVNILSLIHYMKSQSYDKCLFSTVDGDFGLSSTQKFDLHTALVNEFKESNLQYIYFGSKKNVTDDKNSFGSMFFREMRKEYYLLPSFQEYLKNKKQEEESKILASKIEVSNAAITNPDIDYIENIKHMDIILARKKPTAFEQQLVKLLINTHDSYKQYFFKNLGNNGLV